MNKLINNNQNKMIKEIANIIDEIKLNLEKEIVSSAVSSKWHVGRIITNNENEYNNRLEYGSEVLKGLSNELTKHLGKGYSVTNLKYMRMFYKAYPDFEKLTHGISWSHYLELMLISDNTKRSFYEKEAISNRWDVRELRRQLETSLFERLLASDGNVNKEKVYQMAKKGQMIANPSDVLKEPYVLEFLNIKENKPIYEKELEYKLIRHLEDFILELGKGFMFVGTQQRIEVNGADYFVDMVFYNKFLKSYVLIDLKREQLRHENIGQMNLYLNYYEENFNDEEDNKPIGIILCAEKDKIMAELALGSITNNIFAQTYTYYIPDKEVLIREVEKIIKSNENK